MTSNRNSCLLVAIILILWGCTTANIAFRGMESAEEAFNDRQRQELVAYMSLETMFPDPKVRALAESAGKGDIAAVASLVAGGVAVDSRGTKGATPLFWAMRTASIDGFRKLLELGADPNIVFGDGGTVMHWSALLETTDYLRIALDHGGNANLVAGSLEHTPLFKAIGSRTSLNSLKMLLDHGADPDVRDSRGNTPAMIAAGMGRFDIVHELLSRGADHSLKGDSGYSLVDLISAKRDLFNPGSEQERSLEEVIACLEERGVDVPD